MKKSITLSVLFLLLLNVFAFAGDETITQEREHSGFTGIEVGSAFVVNIKQGSTYSVSLIGTKKMLSKVTTMVKNGVLKITNNDNCAKSSSSNCENKFYCEDEQVTVNITCPKLDLMKISGAACVKMEGEFKSDKMMISISGASKHTGTIAVDNLELHVSGASKITLKGTAKNINVLVAGASRADLTQLQSDKAEVNASGASSVTVDTNAFDGEASGASRISYTGNPTIIRSDVSGAGSIGQSNR
jgi:hypothetical protein